ncbi:MAG: TPM domain-containing protein [Chitinophagales bacterium]
MAATDFLSDEEKKEIALAIQAAEGGTIGEIRVYLEKKCKDDAMTRALKIFGQLKMELTKDRTGVLIYIAHDDRVFAILGDEGINAKVPENFWDEVKELMAASFAEGNFVSGIKSAIGQCGIHLQKHFPGHEQDTNELSDEVVIGNE